MEKGEKRLEENMINAKHIKRRIIKMKCYLLICLNCQLQEVFPCQQHDESLWADFLHQVYH